MKFCHTHHTGKEIKPNITEEEVVLLEKILAVGSIQHKYTFRLHTALSRARNRSTKDTASFIGINIVTVSRYVRRFNEGGINALLNDKTRLPGKQPISDEVKSELSRIVCNEKPESGTHWSTQELGKRLGIGHSSVNTIRRDHGHKPHKELASYGYTVKSLTDWSMSLGGAGMLIIDPETNSLWGGVDLRREGYVMGW